MNKNRNLIVGALVVVAVLVVWFFWSSTHKRQSANQGGNTESFVVASTERERVERLEPSASSSIIDNSSSKPSSNKDTAEALAEEDEQISENYTVVTDTLFVRENPKRSSAGVGEVKKGATIRVDEVTTGEDISGNSQWGKIKYSNKDYYVWMGGLEKAKEQDTGSKINNQQVVEAVSDIIIDNIIKGDFSSLRGVWVNGSGDKLVIDAEGHLDNGQYLSPVSPNSIKEAGIPYVNLITGNTGSALYIFNTGSTNPEGDNTDTTRPRLVLTDNPSNVKFDDYYYRKEKNQS